MPFPLIDDLINHVLAYLMPELAMHSSYKLNSILSVHSSIEYLYNNITILIMYIPIKLYFYIYLITPAAFHSTIFYFYFYFIPVLFFKKLQRQFLTAAHIIFTLLFEIFKINPSDTQHLLSIWQMTSLHSPYLPYR